jgi:hypothetical protein
MEKKAMARCWTLFVKENDSISQKQNATELVGCFISWALSEAAL